MKTAMQEFFMVLKEFNKELYNTMYNEGILDTAIEKEKEQIIDAYDKGSDVNDDLKPLYGTPEEYYNQTYGVKGRENKTVVEKDKVIKVEPRLGEWGC
jgi:hypothetical protein